MVSKVAVAALVLIVATPILLGYALSFEDVTVVRYEEGDYTNMTYMIKNSTAYGVAPLDIYGLNSNVMSINPFNEDQDKFYPLYNQYSSAASPIDLDHVTQTLPYTAILTAFNYANFVVYGNNYGASEYVSMEMLDANDNTISTVNYCYFAYYSASDGIVHYGYSTNYGLNIVFDSNSDAKKLIFNSVGGYSGSLECDWSLTATTHQQKSENDLYVDLSAGFNVNYSTGAAWPTRPINWTPNAVVDDCVITFDLDSMNPFTLTPGVSYYMRVYAKNPDTSATNNDYRMIRLYYDDSKWYLNTDNVGSLSSDPQYEELIYDAGSGTNCYQIKITKTGYELHYIGAWPAAIAEANYYRTWSVNWGNPIDDDYSICSILINQRGTGGWTAPTKMRFDSATYRAAYYPVTQDYTYNPSKYVGGSSSVTKIGVVDMTGSSIQFGGQTFEVSGNSLIVGTHKINLSSLKFETLATAGGYDNKINGYLISTTPAAAPIVFDGTWLVEVSSAQVTAQSYTQNDKWVPGQFGWDGIDTNFLLAGLFACVACFVGLGLYAHRTGAKVLPLLLVCGGAAVMFFIMI